MRKSRTFALPLKSGYAERVRVLHKTGAGSKFLKKIFEKIWKFGNNAYLCSPVRKTGLEREDNKFIEKTENCTRSKYRENTIYREALILLEELGCQNQAFRNIRDYTMKSLILAQDER